MKVLVDRNNNMIKNKVFPAGGGCSLQSPAAVAVTVRASPPRPRWLPALDVRTATERRQYHLGPQRGSVELNQVW